MTEQAGATITVGVKTGNNSTGQREAKDIVKAIKAGAADLMMKKGIPGAHVVTVKTDAMEGQLSFHGQPSESSGRLMYYVEGELNIGPFKGLTFGGTVQLPKDDLSNYIDDESLFLFQTAKKAAKGEKEVAKLNEKEKELLKAHGVDLTPKRK